MHRVRPSDRLRRLSLALACGLLCLAGSRAAAQSLPSDLLKSGERFLAAFRPVAEDARQSTVRILSDGEPVALGLIVSENGHVLTKASQLRGDVTVVLSDGEETEAEKIAADGDSDLALLKIDAGGLTPAEWTTKEPAVGSWLVSVGTDRSPVAVGVLSVAGREIDPQRGMLGISLDPSTEVPTVVDIIPNSGAAAAGLEVGDVIMTVAGETVSTREALLDRLSYFRPGESLGLVVRRGDKQETLLATLGNESSIMVDRQARQNMMAGPLSVRSGGFDLAFQHDTVLRPEDCGGPIVDLSGRVVGLNIARAGRVESYALPTAAVRPILSKLMSDASRTAQK